MELEHTKLACKRVCFSFQSGIFYNEKGILLEANWICIAD